MENDKAKFKEEFRQRTYRFILDTISLVDSSVKENGRYVLFEQLLRSSASIGANIVEAKSSSSRKDYINYFSIALKSANETIFWLSLLRDAKKLEDVEATRLLKECKELANILAASILTMKGRT